MIPTNQKCARLQCRPRARPALAANPALCLLLLVRPAFAAAPVHVCLRNCGIHMPRAVGIAFRDVNSVAYSTRGIPHGCLHRPSHCRAPCERTGLYPRHVLGPDRIGLCRCSFRPSSFGCGTRPTSTTSSSRWRSVAAGRRGTPTSTTARGKQPPLSRHKNPEKNRSARRASALAVSRGLGLWWAGDGQVGASCLRHCGATIQTPHAQCPYSGESQTRTALRQGRVCFVCQM